MFVRLWRASGKKGEECRKKGDKGKIVGKATIETAKKYGGSDFYLLRKLLIPRAHH